MEPYAVYILTNYTRSVLYIGVTADLRQRIEQHRSGAELDSFVSRNRCYYLLYFELYPSRLDAIAREKQVKGWTRAKKWAIIAAQNPSFEFIEYS